MNLILFVPILTFLNLKAPDVQINDDHQITFILNDQSTVIDIDNALEIEEIYFDDLNNDKKIDVRISLSEPGYTFEAWYIQNKTQKFDHVKGVDFLDNPVFIDNQYLIQSQNLCMDCGWYSELCFFDGENIIPLASITRYENNLEFASPDLKHPSNMNKFHRMFGMSNEEGATLNERTIKDFWKEYCYELKLI